MCMEPTRPRFYFFEQKVSLAIACLVVASVGSWLISVVLIVFCERISWNKLKADNVCYNLFLTFSTLPSIWLAFFFFLTEAGLFVVTYHSIHAHGPSCPNHPGTKVLLHRSSFRSNPCSVFFLEELKNPCSVSLSVDHTIDTRIACAGPTSPVGLDRIIGRSRSACVMRLF